MRYFAIIDGKQVGPMRLDEMPSYGITPDTYVWSKELDNWKKAREVGDVCRFFRNRLFDAAHPGLAKKEEEVEINRNEPENNEALNNVPIRFRRQIMKANPEEVDWTSFNDKPDYTHEPDTWWPFPLLLSLIFFPPLGILAVTMARKSRKAWQSGRNEEAHEYARKGKMAAGMSFSFGVIVFALVLPLFF